MSLMEEIESDIYFLPGVKRSQIVALQDMRVSISFKVCPALIWLHIFTGCDFCCCLPTPLTLTSVGGGSNLPTYSPPASFSVRLANSTVTPAGSVHKSRGDNVVCMWVQLKR